MALKLKAAVPPKVTAVGQVKLVPVIVMTVPLVPLVVVNELIVGVEVFNVKLEDEFAVLTPQVWTDITPEALPAGTVAVNCVALTKVWFATIPLNLTTEELLLKFVPFIVTTLLQVPELGEKDVRVGVFKVKFVEEVAIPPPV